MADEEQRGGSRGHIPATLLLNVGPTIVLALVFSTLIFGAVVGLVVLGDHPVRYYTSDPASTLSASPLIGLMSQVGVLLAWGAGVIGVFAGVFVARARGWRHALPLLAFGVGVAYLSVDDLFLFHEDIYPDWLGLPQKLVVFAYFAIMLAFLWWCRDFLRKQEWPLLALALAGLGLSVALDLERGRLLTDGGIHRWMEDGSKLLGLTFLAAYLVRLSARMLIDAYPLESVYRDADAYRTADSATVLVDTKPIEDQPLGGNIQHVLP